MSRMLHQARWEQVVFWRNRSGVFFTFAFPIMLLFLLGLFAGSGSEGEEYSEFLVPGIAAMGIASVAFQTLAISIAWHRELGILKTLAATPIPPWALIGSKVISVTVIALLEVAVIVLVGAVAFGLAFPVEPLAFITWTAIGIVSMAAIGMGLAQLIPTGESGPAITNAVYLPVVFVSGAFYDVSSLPAWGEAVAVATPLHHLVEPVRASYLGEGTSLGWPIHLAVLGVWAVVGAFVAVRYFRWEPRYAAG